MSENLIPFMLVSISGALIFLGALLPLFIEKIRLIPMSKVLATSAGILLYLSFVELLPLSYNYLDKGLATFIFFLGISVYFIVDKYLPEGNSDNVKKINFLTFVALSVHNFPEGMSVFSAGKESLELGLSTMFAIGIHNITEGLMIAMPLILQGRRKRALLLSSLCSIAEPVGGFFGYIVVDSIWKAQALGIALSFSAGMMVFLVLDRLLPEARREKPKQVAYYLFLGMFFMYLIIH